MTDKIEIQGKTVDEAVSEALLKMGARRDEVDVTVLEEPKSGFLGILGGRPARVVVRKRRGRRDNRRDFRKNDHAPHALGGGGRGGRSRGGTRRSAARTDGNESGGAEARGGGRGSRGGRNEERKEARDDSRGRSRNEPPKDRPNERQEGNRQATGPREGTSRRRGRRGGRRGRGRSGDRPATTEAARGPRQEQRTDQRSGNRQGQRPDQQGGNRQASGRPGGAGRGRGRRDDRRDDGRVAAERPPRTEQPPRTERPPRTEHQAEARVAPDVEPINAAVDAPTPAPAAEQPTERRPAAHIDEQQPEARNMGPEEQITSDVSALRYAKPLRDEGEGGTDENLTKLAAGMLVRAGFPCRCEVMPGEYRLVKIVTDDASAGMLIGRHGQTVDAVEHLVERMAHTVAGERVFMNLDINNYRRRREESLVDRAADAVSSVRNTGEEFHMEPMNARERRIVHLEAEQAGLHTRTEFGQGGKHVVISAVAVAAAEEAEPETMPEAAPAPEASFETAQEEAPEPTSEAAPESAPEEAPEDAPEDAAEDTAEEEPRADI